ncbi:probable E3 ubiquitin-protein ligase makorin-2 [Nephila pilipes]|uniref:Probable E3 ubiquitin-protein ligase makorin-2 n=1 Tax=Nephila pilipes TaxID=299642 RepID=A0A8X6MKS2_NEPPI|nr:probable E3 ubiquitin-protein ligase makorin-2 [Nephila pilipes]
MSGVLSKTNGNYVQDMKIRYLFSDVGFMEYFKIYTFASISKTQMKCEICKKCVSDKKYFSERRFGLLENCSHVFCLGCIREYRARLQLNAFAKRKRNYCTPVAIRCPICRVESHYIIASKSWLEDPKKKVQLLEIYKKLTEEVYCPWFKSGQGECLYSNCSGHILEPDRENPNEEKNEETGCD